MFSLKMYELPNVLASGHICIPTLSVVSRSDDNWHLSPPDVTLSSGELPELCDALNDDDL